VARVYAVRRYDICKVGGSIGCFKAWDGVFFFFFFTFSSSSV